MGRLVKPPSKGAKILVFDIETAPVIGYVWSLWDQNVAVNQIRSDWHLLSWSAKWLGDPENKIMYEDQRAATKVEDDAKLLRNIWKLLDQADVVVTQNGREFDSKKLNARFIINRMQPPSSYKHIDTKIIAKKNFAFTSNGLEYMSDKLCTKYKKLKSKKFIGFDLWRECLAGNVAAFKEMERYNKHDVLALEELYLRVRAWDDTINLNVYNDGVPEACKCGSKNLKPRGFYYTKTSKYQKFRCGDCGAETRARINVMPEHKRKDRVGTR